jgi:hypothetical protein
MVWTFMQEHLLSFSLEFLAAVVGAWVFSAWYPTISDYRARRSKRAIIQKVDQLQKSLEQYDEEEKETKLFVVRIIRLSTVTILAALLTLTIAGVIVTVNYSVDIMCKMEPNKCVMLPGEGYLMIGESGELIYQVGFFILVAIACYVLFICVRTLQRETKPQSYRSFMTKRIASLRGRL